MSTDAQPGDTSRVSPLWASALVTAVIALALAIWLTHPALTGGGASHFIPALFVLAFDAIPVSGWMIAAWGYGALVRRSLRLPALELGPLDLGFGVPALLWLDHALGAAGVLQLGGSAGGWLLLCVGWLAALLSLRERLIARSLSFKIGGWSTFALVGAVPAAMVLLIAATSAPGWMWASEANGYDVLEYHLHMPREWLALGSVTPLRHNVYSFAPSYVEAAYYHLAVLLDPLATRPSNGAVAAATACQLLHAALMLWAAREVLLLARRFTSHWMALAAGAIAISVPWVIVTGSMAYNEAPLIGLLALSWRLVDARPTATRSFVLLGVLTGLACGAKLTAIGGVVAPIGVLLLMRLSPAQWPRMILGCVAGGLIALAPYLVRNFVALGGANPFFPFLMDLLGSAHWTPEQAARWNGAHASDAPWLARLGGLWTMGFMHAQWAGVWFVALLALPAAWVMRSHRRAVRDAVTILAIQLIFWFALTHLQSRFLMPCLAPLVILIAMGLETLAQRWRSGAFGISIALPLLLGIWTVRLYEQQGQGYPAAFIDGTSIRTGVAAVPFNQADAAQLASENSDVFLNLYVRSEQPVYLLGDATPFYILHPVTWHTTWDTSPLGQIIRAHGDDQDAWARALIDRGHTLVLVNFAELHRLGRKDGWYDPVVAKVDLQEFFETHARRAASWPGGRVLYEIRPPNP